MDKKVTIYTLAEELNMTPSMVSRGLSANGKVSKENREKILKMAEKYNYTANRHAARLSMKTLKIGVLIHSNFKVHVREMLRGIEAAYEELKDYKISYDVTVVYGEEKEKWECAEELNRYIGYDGVLICGFSHKKCIPMLQEFSKKNPNIVQFQSINSHINYLFGSRHNGVLASEMAAEFLGNCLQYKETKNVLLFTGSQHSSVHSSAMEAFLKAADTYNLHVLECVDMQDSNLILRECLPVLFEKYQNKIDGIYITSGVSIELCKFVENYDCCLVTFDIYDELASYIERRVVRASVFQDVFKQSKTAFEKFVRYSIDGEQVEKEIFTNITLITKSNLHIYTNHSVS